MIRFTKATEHIVFPHYRESLLLQFGISRRFKAQLTSRNGSDPGSVRRRDERIAPLSMEAGRGLRAQSAVQSAQQPETARRMYRANKLVKDFTVNLRKGKGEARIIGGRRKLRLRRPGLNASFSHPS